MKVIRARAQKENAHGVAAEAWSEIDRRPSRCVGLGEMLRASLRPSKPLRTAEQRSQMQNDHKARLRGVNTRARKRMEPWNPRAADRSRYFPHQSDRERNRRARKIAA